MDPVSRAAGVLFIKMYLDSVFKLNVIPNTFSIKTTAFIESDIPVIHNRKPSQTNFNSNVCEQTQPLHCESPPISINDINRPYLRKRHGKAIMSEKTKLL